MNIAQFEQWLKLFNEYTWPAVLFLAILFWWFLPWVKKLVKKSEAPGLADYHLTEAIECEQAITTLLAQAAVSCGCQWAVLWQFHNGTVSTGGIPFMRMTVTNEFTEMGLFPRGDQYQGIPISVFADALAEISKNGLIRVGMHSQYKAITNSYKAEGVGSGYYFKVTNEKDQFIGVLSVTFRDELVLPEFKVTCLTQFASRLAIVMGKIAANYKKPERRIND
jgi:hypothetical protein